MNEYRSAEKRIAAYNRDDIESAMRETWGNWIVGFSTAETDGGFTNLSVIVRNDISGIDLTQVKYFFYGLCYGK